MIPLELGGLVVDVGGIIAGVAAIIAAVAAIGSSRSSKKAAVTLTTNNGGSTFKDAQDRQELALQAILDGQRSQGHQLGELKADLGRLDTRLSADVRELRGLVPPQA